jgi:hypothetical protein
MPPLCRNQRAATAGEIPAAAPASSVVKPFAMADQKRCDPLEEPPADGLAADIPNFLDPTRLQILVVTEQDVPLLVPRS